jgi:FtsZ-interacting cell division protein ZipA
MSELQFSLIILGLIVIACVYLFNLRQERRLREHLQEDSAAEPAAVEAAASEPGTDQLEIESQSETEIEPETRREPSYIETALDTAPEPPSISPEPRLTAAPQPTPRQKTADVDFRAVLTGGAPLHGEIRARLEKELGGIGKPIRIEMREAGDGPWILAEADAEPVGPARIALQLADRRGAASAAQLARFREIVDEIASELGASVAYDDEAFALEKAAALDEFCADNDVAIGVNIIPDDVTGLSGTKLRALAESSGFALTADGAFHLLDDRGATLIALASMDGVPFEAGSMKHLRSQGVTLVIDVARVADGGQVFRRMTELARHFAHGLNGTIVDDNRAPLSPAGLDKIAAQIESIQGALKGGGILPGSPLALRLFS